MKLLNPQSDLLLRQVSVPKQSHGVWPASVAYRSYLVYLVAYSPAIEADMSQTHYITKPTEYIL